MLLVPALFWHGCGKDRKVPWQRAGKANTGETAAFICFFFLASVTNHQELSDGKQFVFVICANAVMIKNNTGLNEYWIIALSRTCISVQLLLMSGIKDKMIFRTCMWPEPCVWLFLKRGLVVSALWSHGSWCAERLSCSILFSQRKGSTRSPQALSFTGWPTGERRSQHNLTADVCPSTICTNVKLNSLPCP